jgi:hypothetical protein
MTIDDITHCLYGRSRRSTTPCSLRFCFLRTGQTAVASIPRLSLSGLREMRSSLRLFCLPSRATYLLDDLPVSSLHCSDPAWPARLLTRGCTVSEHLLILVHSRGSTGLFSHTCLKAERRYIPRDNNSCQHFGELVPTLRFALNALRQELSFTVGSPFACVACTCYASLCFSLLP